MRIKRFSGKRDKSSYRIFIYAPKKTHAFIEFDFYLGVIFRNFHLKSHNIVLDLIRTLVVDKTLRSLF